MLRPRTRACPPDELSGIIEAHRDAVHPAGKRAHIRKDPLLPEHSTGKRRTPGDVGHRHRDLTRFVNGAGRTAVEAWQRAKIGKDATTKYKAVRGKHIDAFDNYVTSDLPGR